MRRQLVFASILTVFGWASPAFGLGMGDIDTSSALNERFSARIPLNEVGDTNPQNLKVTLASPEAFERAGIRRAGYLARLDFQVKEAEDGSLYVDVTSGEPIKEPFLDFLIRVRWPQGQMVREYTVLLDPPTTTGERAVAQGDDGGTEDAAGDEVEGTSSPERQEATTAAGDDAQTGEAGASDAGTGGDVPESYGPVAANENLYRIANKVRPDGVTTNQAMIALLRNNPQAFIDENINLLREGTELEVPEGSEMRSVSAREATAEVEKQIAAWRERQGEQVAEAGDREAADEQDADEAGGSDQTASASETDDEETGTEAGSEDAEDTQADNGEQVADGGRLDLGEVEGPDSVDTQTLANSQLAVNQETVKTLQERLKEQRTNNESLKSQTEDQRQQLEDLREELAETKAELEELKQQGGGSAGGDGDKPVNAPGESPDAGDDDQEAADSGGPQGDQQASAGGPDGGASEDASGSADDGQTDDTGAQTAGADDSASDAGESEQEQGSQEEQASGGIVDWLMANLLALALGIGGVVVVSLAGLIWMRRRREGAEDEEGDLAAPTSVPSLDETPAGGGGSSAADAAPASDETSQPDAGSGDSDPMAEADAYIAAGNLAQANEILDAALGTNPENKELRYKLLEVLAERGDRGGFEAEAQVLHTQLDSETDPLWQSTVELGKRIAPEHPLFSDAAQEGQAGSGGGPSAGQAAGAAAGAAAAPMPETDADTDFDLSFDAESEDASGSGGAAASSGEGDIGGDDFDLDFDLDAEETSSTGTDTASTAGQAGDSDNELDFDLDSAGVGSAADETGAESSADDSAPAMDFDLDFDEGDSGSAPTQSASESGSDQAEETGLDFDLEFDEGGSESASTQGPAASDSSSGDDGGLEFDLPDDLDLSLGGEESGGDGESAASGAETADTDSGSEGPSAADAGESSEAGGGEAGGSDAAMDDLDSMDEVATKLDLAQAYLDMGDPEGAKGLLTEVVDEGDASQKQQAQELLEQAG